ncbi:LemA family protein [Mariniblastus sp.]|nr:LemA family protein [Mariniblastus sp.]
MTISLGVVAAAAVLVALWVISIYNKLISLRNMFENGFAQIDVQLKRRYDLIPNLVNTAKGYMAHEKETLEAVIQARNQALTASTAAAANPGEKASMNQLTSAESNLDGAIGRLLMIAESYPDLKANENMLAIQEELVSTENKIAFSRQAFNDGATRYNTYLQQFPTNIIGGMFKFSSCQLFEVDEPTERKAPKVEF